MGLPAGLDPATTSSLELKLVANLVGQLEGQLVVDRQSAAGSSFTVFFPVPADARCEGES